MQFTIVLFGLILLVYVLNALSGIIIPLAFASLAAILLNPIFNWICRPRVPRAISVLLTVLIGIAAFALIAYLIGSEMAQFGSSFPALKVCSGT